MNTQIIYKKNEINTIIDLPISVIDNILKYLTDTDSYSNLRISCKSFYNILETLKRYNNNILVELIGYKYGALNGLHIQWYDTQIIKSITKYKHNKKTDKQMLYYENGDIKKDTKYVSNLKHGKEISYYINNTIQKKTTYSFNRKDKEEYIYNRNGDLVMKKLFDSILTDKDFTLCYYKDKLLIAKSFFKNDILDGITTRYIDNNIIEEEYDNGELIKIKTYKNNVLIDKKYIEDGLLNGYYYQWHDNKQLKCICYYNKGRVDKIYKKWSHDKKYTETLTLNKCKLDGLFKINTTYYYKIIPYKNNMIHGNYIESMKYSKITYILKFNYGIFGNSFKKKICDKLDTKVIIRENFFVYNKYISNRLSYQIKIIDNKLTLSYYNMLESIVTSYCINLNNN